MWDITEMTADEVIRERRRYEPLTASIRELVEAALLTDVEDEEAWALAAELGEAATRLRARRRPVPPGVSTTPEGDTVGWSDMASGLRNPLAPPLVVQQESETRSRIDVELGVAYTGAPGHLHGGYAALLLDHVCGDVASRGRAETVAATGTLTLRYHRPTRLGRLSATAEVQGTEGRKIFLTAHLSDAEGVTVSAEGVFIALNRPS